MKRYNKNELLQKLQEFENELIYLDRYEKVTLGIVGGASLLFLEATERTVTKDIDSIAIIEMRDNGLSYTSVRHFTKDTSFEELINSDVTVFNTFGLIEYETEWIKVFEGSEGIVTALSASLEMIVSFKLIAMADKERDSDMKDLSSKNVIKNTDPSRVKWLLEEMFTYLASEKQVREIKREFNFWVKAHYKNLELEIK